MQIRTKLKEITRIYTRISQKTTILTVLLAGLITTTGYNTKTALQKLSETIKI
jgi:hypothetical protein